MFFVDFIEIFHRLFHRFYMDNCSWIFFIWIVFMDFFMDCLWIVYEFFQHLGFIYVQISSFLFFFCYSELDQILQDTRQKNNFGRKKKLFLQENKLRKLNLSHLLLLVFFLILEFCFFTRFVFFAHILFQYPFSSKSICVLLYDSKHS